MTERRVTLDSEKLRALAHPLRARLLGSLRSQGPGTSTTLAQRLGTNSGATSYHLRKLATVGLVEDDPDKSSGRDRCWRAAHESTNWSTGDFLDDPDDRAAANWLLVYHARSMQEQVDAWLESYHLESHSWIKAGQMNDARLRLTPEQVEAMADAILEVIERYKTQPAKGDEARSVFVHFNAFPNQLGEPAEGSTSNPDSPSSQD